MTSIEEIYSLEKIWQKAYDFSKATEESISKEDKVKYWLKVHIAWKIQEAIREKIVAMTSQYIKENTDKFIEEYSTNKSEVEK